MKPRLYFLIPLLLLTSASCSGEKPSAPTPAPAAASSQPITQTFYVSGLECGSCAYMVQQSIRDSKGVSDAFVVQLLDSYANISFDPRLISEHQIAQAVRDTYPIHAKPYLATLKLRMPAYAQDANAAKVDAAFARWKEWVTLETVDKAKGIFLVHFLPLTVDPKKPGPQGWSLAQLTTALQSPTGPGIAFTVEKETP